MATTTRKRRLQRMGTWPRGQFGLAWLTWDHTRLQARRRARIAGARRLAGRG